MGIHMMLETSDILQTYDRKVLLEAYTGVDAIRRYLKDDSKVFFQRLRVHDSVVGATELR
jgi:hypothetical protein